MTAANLMKQAGGVRVRKVAGEKVAMVPLKAWEDIEDYLEEIATQSPVFIAKLKKARAEKKSYTLEEVQKRLGL